MNTYITLLRGINVSGQKLIKMADLRTLLKTLNFQNVDTYIQSGNIIFKSEGFTTEQLKVDATARNWNTVNKLIGMAEAIS